jgi:hypothetical protein
MAVEIHILSGVRRHERIALDCRAFQVGCDPNCEVFFDPKKDAAARGRTVKFRLQEGGWFVRCSGGDMWIGTKPIAGATHIRSGDTIRMSATGPEFSFNIVAAANVSPGKTPSDEVAATPIPGGSAVSGHSIGAMVSPAESQASGLSLATPTPHNANPQTTSAETTPVKGRDRQQLLWVAGGVAVAILAMIALRAVFFPSPVNNIIINPPPSPPVPPVVANDPDRKKGTVKRKERTDTRETGDPRDHATPTPVAAGDETIKPKEQVRPTIDPVAQLDGAIFLIVAEKKGQFYRHATCVAVGKDTLLTTAYDAMDLAEMRHKGSCKIWVIRPAGNLKFSFKSEIHDIRVLVPYAALSEKSPKSADLNFLDIGLLTVKDPLPKIAPLASSKELNQVAKGLPVHCLGFACEDEDRELTSFDKPEPRLTRAKVRTKETATKLPGQPGLLHVRGQMPKDAYGSPVINDAGKIVGLYSDAVPKEKSGGIDNLHYVTVLNLEQINLWLRDRDNATIWVPAAPVSTPPKTKKQL